MIKTSIALPLIYALLLTFASCGEKNYQNSGAVWGTTYHITYTAPYDLGDSIIAVMADIENELSMFSPSSTVSRINRNEGDVSVGNAFADVFNLSRHISRLTSGAFDPTVGPLTNIWGFGTASIDPSSTPTQQAIDSVLTSVGIIDCHIDGSRIIKKTPDTQFDFSSIAKGYGVDAVAAMLARNGSRDYLVEIGGEIVAHGVNPRGKQWQIQIDAPTSDAETHDAMIIIPISNAAVATSGNYRNYRIADGKRIGHTLDPRTGRPAESATLSATIVAPDCATADALATACMVMDAENAIKIIEQMPDTEALLAVASADSIALIRSSRFPKGR